MSSNDIVVEGQFDNYRLVANGVSVSSATTLDFNRCLLVLRPSLQHFCHSVSIADFVVALGKMVILKL